MKLEVFNGVTAYLFLNVIQIFNEQHPQDFSEEDKTVEDQYKESDLFLQPKVKQRFGWTTVGILLAYLATHLFLFAKIVLADCKDKIKAKC